MKRIAFFLIGVFMLCSCTKKLSPEETPVVRINNHDAVDLGLSVMWSSCNLGASSLSEYGGYYGWGETHEIGKKPSTNQLFRDAATSSWGRPWRMPTVEEVSELLLLRRKPAVINGIKGLIITGKNGHSIFLPYSGSVREDEDGIRMRAEMGDYWTTNQFFGLDDRTVNTLFITDLGPRLSKQSILSRMSNFEVLKMGLSIRPVCSFPKETDNKPTIGQENGHQWVDLGLSSGTKWATMNIGAADEYSTGNLFAWGETQPRSLNSEIKWSQYKFYVSGTNSYSSSVVLSKYNAVNERYGKIDNLTILMKEDDAAAQNWGGNWQMPTIEQWNELITQCKWTWMEGQGYYSIEGPNRNKIILNLTEANAKSNSYKVPEAGYPSFYTNCYWTKNLRDEICHEAYCTVITNNYPFLKYISRINCCCILPVIK